MIEIKITPQMKKRAWAKARQMGKLRNSITRGKGNIAGFLGEEVANALIKGTISNTYDYDILYKNIKYDVKTKRCTSPPKPFYECSVAAYNTKQKCDRYIFVRIEWVNGKWGRAWVLGWLDHKEYFNNAENLNRGDIDRSNGYMVKADCYNVPINKLRNFRRRK